MGYYFDDSQSINAYEGTDPQAIISSLAYRYMGQADVTFNLTLNNVTVEYNRLQIPC